MYIFNVNDFKWTLVKKYKLLLQSVNLLHLERCRKNHIKIFTLLVLLTN